MGRLANLQSMLLGEISPDIDSSLILETDRESELTPTSKQDAVPPIHFGSVQLVEISKIRRSPFQPRNYFNPDKIARMAEKFRKYRETGRYPKTAILVRPVSDGDGYEYEFVFGETRTIAHAQAGFDYVQAFVDDLSDEDSRELALTENLLREDLNPVEKTEAILELAAARLRCSTDEVRQLLDRAAHQRRQNADNVIRTEAWQTLASFFEELPDRITPESFRVNYLPLLNLPPDILEALHEGKLAYTKARAIASVKDEQVRSELLTQAIKQDWSIRMIRDQIKTLSASEPKPIPLAQSPKAFSDRMGQLQKRLSRVQTVSDSKAKKLEALLSQVEQLLDKLEA